MRERPILFDAESVRAILAGRKTQTRRVMKPQPQESYTEDLVRHERRSYGWMWKPRDFHWQCPGQHMIALCPYGVIGDRMWVRETWAAVWPDCDPVPMDECNIEYRADLAPGCTDYPGQWPADEARGNLDSPRWRSPMHMPRRFSRITLEVTGVRVEHLWDIREADVVAEGVEIAHSVNGSLRYVSYRDPKDPGVSYLENFPEIAFSFLWDSCNEKHGFGWDTNPWVWVIAFRRV